MCKLFLKLNENITFTFVFLGELSRGSTAVSEKVAAAIKIQSFYRKYKTPEIQIRFETSLLIKSFQ